MKILLASARPNEVRWASENGLIDGIVTTPALLALERPDDNGHELLGELCAIAPGPVHASVESVTGEDIYRDGKELAKISDRIVVQIPLIEEAVGAIRRLEAEGVRVTATLIFNAAQAILAARAGARAVSIGLDRLDASGLDGVEVLRELRAVFDSDATECDLRAEYPRDAGHFAACTLAGADSITVAPSILRMLLVHPLTDRGLDDFLNDISRRHTNRSQS
ncbi:MAG: transaldolase family protein [Gemmatimonadaceae bacterium]